MGSSSNNVSSSSPSGSPGATASPVLAVSPMMFDLYPLSGVLFHAGVICAHAGLGLGLNKTMWAMDNGGAAVLEDAAGALGLFMGEEREIGVGVGGDAKRMMIAEVVYGRVVEKMEKVKTAKAGNGLKRKHDQIDLRSGFGIIIPERGPNAVSSGQYHQYQHNALVELRPSPPPPPPPVSINFPRDNRAQSEQQKKELSSVVRLAAAEQKRDEKQQKYPKKTAQPTTYPSVGIRVRPHTKDTISASSRTRPNQHSLSVGSHHQHQHRQSHQHQQSIMASAQRTLTTADAVLAYQQQQKQKMQGAGSGSSAALPPSTPSTMYEEDMSRSRSPSFSHVPSHPQVQQQQHPADGGSAAHDSGMQYPSYFEGSASSSDIMNIQMMQGRRFSAQEQPSQQQQQQQQPISPPEQNPPYTPHIFDQTHSQAIYDPTPTYDAMRNSSGPSVEGMGYSAVSSPFSNAAPPSSSGSPFTTTSVVSSGQPSTPTFPPHHPNAPVFGPHTSDHPPSTSSPTSYYHTTPTVFNESTYSGPPTSSSHPSHQQSHSQGQQQQQHGGAPHNGNNNISLQMNMEQRMIGIPGASGAAYNKMSSSQRQAATMYGMKAEQHQIVHHQRMQHQAQALDSPYEDHDMSGPNQQLGMGMPTAATWTSPEQQHQQQPHQQHPAASNQPFWNNGTDYRFYP